MDVYICAKFNLAIYLLSSISPISDLRTRHVLLYSDRSVNPHYMSAHNFLEVGAAALLVGDMEAKMKGQPWKFFGTADLPYLDQLLQPSPVTTISNSVHARPHLRAITASKRTKPGPRQIWHVLLSQNIALTCLVFPIIVIFSHLFGYRSIEHCIY